MGGKRLLCADRGVSFDLQGKTRRQVLVSKPQLETQKGVLCIGMRRPAENASSFKERLNKKRIEGERTRIRRHLSIRSQSPQQNKPTGERPCDPPGQSEGWGRERGIRSRKVNQYFLQSRKLMRRHWSAALKQQRSCRSQVEGDEFNRFDVMESNESKKKLSQRSQIKAASRIKRAKS